MSWTAWNDLSDQQSAKNQLFQQSSASASSANNTDPAVVAKRWSEIVNKGDVNAVNDVFTPDVVFIGGPPCAVRTPCTGVAAMPKRVEDAAAAHQQHQNVTAVAAGNVAQVRWENVSDPQRKAASTASSSWLKQRSAATRSRPGPFSRTSAILKR